MASPWTPARTCTPQAVSSTSCSPASPPSRATPRWPSRTSTCGRSPSGPPRWRPMSPSPWTGSFSSHWPRAERTATRTPPICEPTFRPQPGACPWRPRRPIPGPPLLRPWRRQPRSRFSPPPPSPRCPPSPLRRPRRGMRSPRTSPRTTPGCGSSSSCCSRSWPSSPAGWPPEHSTTLGRPRRRARLSPLWRFPTSVVRTRTRPGRPLRTPD